MLVIVNPQNTVSASYTILQCQTLHSSMSSSFGEKFYNQKIGLIYLKLGFITKWNDANKQTLV